MALFRKASVMIKLKLKDDALSIFQKSFCLTKHLKKTGKSTFESHQIDYLFFLLRLFKKELMENIGIKD